MYTIFGWFATSKIITNDRIGKTALTFFPGTRGWTQCRHKQRGCPGRREWWIQQTRLYWLAPTPQPEEYQLHNKWATRWRRWGAVNIEPEYSSVEQYTCSTSHTITHYSVVGEFNGREYIQCIVSHQNEDPIKTSMSRCRHGVLTVNIQ